MSDDPLLWEPYDRHWIRLRGPWDVTWLAPPPDNTMPAAVTSERVRLPAAWHELFGKRVGTARFSRRFQQPTNLDAEERVLVTLCEVRCEVRAKLNASPLIPLDTPIGDPASAACEDTLSFEITPLLQPSNLLTLELTVHAPEKRERSCGLWRPVLLEVITPE
jgi:hypothetical protein